MKKVKRILAAACWSLAILFPGCSGESGKIRPTINTITESVYASATVQPDSMYKVHAAVSGILEKNLVREGDLVQTGTPLLKITDRSPELSRENARLQMELAASNYQGSTTPLRDLASRIETARLAYIDDSVNFRRQEKLWSQQIGSRATFENRKLAYERSRNQLDQLQTEYARLERELRTKMEQARNSYRSYQANADEFTVRSFIDGKVYALFKEPGELVVPNEPLATLGKPDSFVVELLVDEVDIVRLRTGQEVLVSLDAYPDEVFRAGLTRIYPQKDSRNQTFLAEARFEAPPNQLYPGLSGEANIVIDRRENALTIPRNLLLAGDSVLTEDGMKKVVTGLQTLDRVEIRSGLDAGTNILKPEQ
ncbi:MULTISPECIES: efflux RND transporter periplasmic adaptor subunit [unclassified Robiginitalea]|uniref:efflux RND transporter periplasmic adaptor subunit n=1 Tax=Robiginitalea TaxID=252306 RepID=UPI00234ADDD1|nr:MULTISPECIES: HlyD family efflux transporter periplasmic adaptor subunit [unclassified Robiginitalea]MDC6355158.1 HlyD family efflux transporter periplasmic adaptor subunit [Robiginitalea sp. PM2]MDC6375627.1 HlyD family efflux transporter periplasmic adaptor subunit [Robiginitalea sp. SP8]